MINLNHNLSQNTNITNEKTKVILNVLSEQSDEDYFFKKTGLKFKEESIGNNNPTFYFIHYFSEKKNEWNKYNLMDIVFKPNIFENQTKLPNIIGRILNLK